MLEVSIARLRSRLAAILEAVRAGEPVVIRRHGTRIALLTGWKPAERRASTRQALRGSSKLPRIKDTGPVIPVKLRRRLKRAPSDELSEERE